VSVRVNVSWWFLVFSAYFFHVVLMCVCSACVSCSHDVGVIKNDANQWQLIPAMAYYVSRGTLNLTHSNSDSCLDTWQSITWLIMTKINGARKTHNSINTNINAHQTQKKLSYLSSLTTLGQETTWIYFKATGTTQGELDEDVDEVTSSPYGWPY